MFDAWFDREEQKNDDFMDMVIDLSKKEAKRIFANGGGMKLRRKRGGWDCYE
jgi:hypothetical protein